MRYENACEEFIEAEFEVLEITFGGEAGSIEFFERFGDAFCLRTRKATLLQFLNDAVGVEHQGLHRLSVYQLIARWQVVEFMSALEVLPPSAATTPVRGWVSM